MENQKEIPSNNQEEEDEIDIILKTFTTNHIMFDIDELLLVIDENDFKLKLLEEAKIFIEDGFIEIENIDYEVETNPIKVLKKILPDYGNRLAYLREFLNFEKLDKRVREIIKEAKK
jgi:hypothetical protein